MHEIKFSKGNIGMITNGLMICFGIIFIMLVALFAYAKMKRRESVYIGELEEQNPFVGKKVVFVNKNDEELNADGVKGHLVVIGDSKYSPKFYEKYVKRMLDVLLSFCGMAILSPVFIAFSILILIDDPGPVFFTQKRVGRNKEFFKLHKFRSMKMATPHDTPTHMLENPEQYITKIGRFMRVHSLDELPQLWDIFIGNMSVIGPRPALWNQDVLIAERDKYNANDIRPGLTGWAQINGRDAIEICEKAKLDGEYVKKQSFLFDVKCFLGTISKVGCDDSVVEGGTGKMEKEESGRGLTGTDKVSVVMATYRRDVALQKALTSLVNQTYKNFEVVLVDDNADMQWSRKVLKIVEELKGQVDIVYIVNKRNLGSAEARNKGIMAASGKYITFLDDDDVYMPEKIEKQLKDFVINNADYGITDLYLYNEDEVLVDKRIRTYIKSIVPDELMRYHLMYHMTGTDTFMFRKEYILDIGGFKGIDVGDEFYLMKDAILRGGRFVYSDHCYVKAYIHTGEDSGLSSGQKKIEGENILFQKKKEYYNYLKKKDIRYVEMRHYAVIAFAEMRRGAWANSAKNVFISFFKSPFGFFKLIGGAR